MDLSTVTVADFKGLFRRDFPYLPEYDNTKTYNTGVVVYYATTDLFYQCLQDYTVGHLPTDTAYWVKYDASLDDYVQDDDIDRAFDEAEFNINQGIFSTDAQIQLAYLYVTAHYLVNDMRAAMQGIESSGSFNVSARSVGRVSETYAIPQRYLDSPALSFFTTSAYGMKYLSLVMPHLVGNIGIVGGGTNP